jgi:uncharacterized protein
MFPSAGVRLAGTLLPRQEKRESAVDGPAWAQCVTIRSRGMKALITGSILLLVACGTRQGTEDAKGKIRPDTNTELQRSCAAGNGSHCVELGGRHASGDGTAREYATAARYYVAGCEAGNAAGCHAAGQAYLVGAGVPRDLARATTLLTKAYDGRDPHGCFKLGSLLAGGAFGPPTDPPRGLLAVAKACELGHAGGCFRAGTLLETGAPGIEADLPRSTRYYEMGCNEPTAHGSAPIGDASSCWRLGVLYRDGVVKGKSRADGDALLSRTLRDYSQQCDGGAAWACLSLGVIRATGDGAERDTARALELFDRACALENPAGCQWAKQLRSTPAPKSP